MNWDAIGSIAEVVGAVAVVISLVYLAWQIRDSRRSDQIVAAAAVASAIDEWLGQIVSDEGLYDLYERGLADYESLSRSETGRFSLMIPQFLRSAETAWRQQQMGFAEGDYWVGIKATMQFVVGSPGGKKAFARDRYYLSPDFVDVVQKILDETALAKNIYTPD